MLFSIYLSMHISDAHALSELLSGRWPWQESPLSFVESLHTLHLNKFCIFHSKAVFCEKVNKS